MEIGEVLTKLRHFLRISDGSFILSKAKSLIFISFNLFPDKGV